MVLVGFFVLGLLAYRTYMAHPPVPERVVDPRGSTLFTGSDISHGQKIFLNSGLMEYGSVFGHGAYLGPDFTADYLRRASDIAMRLLRRPELRFGAAERRSTTSAGTATTRRPRTLALQRGAGRGVPRARPVLQPTSSPTRRPSTA